MSYSDFLMVYIAGRHRDVQEQLTQLTYLHALIGDPSLNTSHEIEAAAQKIIARKPQSWRTKADELQKLAGIQAETEALERELTATYLDLE